MTSSTALNFFWNRNKPETNDEKEAADAPPAVEAPQAVESTPIEETKPRKPSNPLTPAELKAQAAQMRLEAERMEVELTLQKIAKLEAQLATNASDVNTAQLQALQRKLKGDDKETPKETPKDTTSSSFINGKSPYAPLAPQLLESLEQAPLLSQMLKTSLGLQELTDHQLAQQLYRNQTVTEWNDATASLSLRLPFADHPADVEGYQQGVISNSGNTLLQSVMNEVAREIDEDDGEKDLRDSVVSDAFPPCVTQRQVDMPAVSRLLQQLPTWGYSVTSKMTVPGGFLLQGSLANGDDMNDLLDKVDALDYNLTVSYVQGPVSFDKFKEIVQDIQEWKDVLERITKEPDPVLYVTAKDVMRTKRPVLYSLVTATGLATSWYLSLFPFVLNNDVARRLDDALSFGSGVEDLDWLTDQSVPLFLAFLALQVVHEVGHWTVASARQVRLSPPTLIPSILTGITSILTNFRTLPRNREALLEIATAGPLVGMLASLGCLLVGTQLPLADVTPALPIEIVRQSTLGLALLNPSTTEPLVALHPLCVAGFIGLIVNALAALPTGSTYMCH